MTRTNKRSCSKYPGLNKQTTLKIRADLVDQDYIAKLQDKDKEWLNNFNEEWIHAHLSHSGERFHNTPLETKQIYDMNNARNRDIYRRSQITGKLIMHVSTTDVVQPSPEDTLIECIDFNTELCSFIKDLEKK